MKTKNVTLLTSSTCEEILKVPGAASGTPVTGSLAMPRYTWANRNSASAAVSIATARP